MPKDLSMAARYRGTPEITRVRGDGSASATSKITDSLEEKIKARTAKNSAYQKYKDQLHEFFDGKRELPEHMREMLATRPGAEEHGIVADDKPEADEPPAKKKKNKNKKADSSSEPLRAETNGKPRRRIAGRSDARAQHIAALRESNSPREAEVAIDAMRAEGFSLPLEVDLLSKALGHTDEDVFSEALRGLNQIGLSPETPGAKLLKGRIANVALVASSAETRELCTELQAALNG
jgi:hypothetical protein